MLPADCIQKRQIQNETFDFVVVDSHDKWEPASEIKTDFRLTIPGSNQVLLIPLTGLSYEQQTAIMAKLPWPDWTEDGEVPPAIKIAQDQCRQARRIATLETAMGTQIPGKDFTEKQVRINQSNPGNLDALDTFVRRDLNNTSTYTGIYLAAYQQMRERFPEENVETVSSFDDFFSKTQDVIHCFHTNRVGQNYILEFPLRSLTAEKKEQIESQTPQPTPPMIPVFHQATRQPIPGRMKSNTSDKTYIQAVNNMNKRRTMLYLNACLPFRIPGESDEEQMRWLGDRLVGDIYQITEYINNVILGIEGRYHFFTTV